MLFCADIALDKNSPEPLHIQLVRELRFRIRALNPGSGDTLPSERSLCEQLSLNRSTVHRAYAELLDTGVVRRNPDKSLSLNSGARKKLEGALPSIGVVIPGKFSDYIESNDRAALRYLKGVIDRATELNYAVFMFEPPPPQAPQCDVERFIAERIGRLTGLIHLGDRAIFPDNALNTVLNYSGIPQICISGFAAQPHVGAVFTNLTQAGKILSAELLRRKFRSVGTIESYSPRRDCESTLFRYAAVEREPRMREIFVSAGLDVPEEWELPNDERLLRRKLEHGILPDALWCGNDLTAMVVLKILDELKIKVPQTVSVIGFDGIFEPGYLATIRQDFHRIGAGAVELLLEHFEHGITEKNRFRAIPAEFADGKTMGEIPPPNRRKK